MDKANQNARRTRSYVVPHHAFKHAHNPIVSDALLPVDRNKLRAASRGTTLPEEVLSHCPQTVRYPRMTFIHR